MIDPTSPSIERALPNTNAPRADVPTSETVAPVAGYSTAYRMVEIGSITTFLALMGVLVVRIVPHALVHPYLVTAAFIAGNLAADFVCGFFHWGADTWGDSRTPIVGNPLIRPFREHHVDAKSMTKHDLIETNGTNCLMSLPGYLVALTIPLSAGDHYGLRLFIVGFFASLLLWAMATNQFHKWAHTDDPPRVVALLQKLHLILPPKHHAVHHSAPFDKYYCITTGWMNWPLAKLGFFRISERVITATLGWQTRKAEPSGDARSGPHG